ncbi:MAG: acetylornithine/succinylornithine family transaminase [Gemmatimonadota bacterium]|nr:acetylornithine/succinylornithine family transaminase [Gemmatimonadota bacterium]
MTLPVMQVSDNSPAPALQKPAILGTYKRPPVEMVRGDGMYLYDANGKAYLDFSSGIAVNAFGYNDAGIRGAMEEALQTGLIHTSNLFRTRPGEELAQFLVDHSFASSVFFCNSGAEANEGAFKFARKLGRSIAPEKTGIISLRGAFHGRLFATLAATDRATYQAPFMPLAPGVSISERTIEDLDAVLGAGTVAAVIVEPVQGEGGVRVIDRGLLAELRAMTHERRIALIFDEIQSGLGRTGTLFAYEQTGIVPDMVTLAKPIAGGLPMGVVMMTDQVASVMSPGDHGTTFGGGPFVASVALHVVKRIAEPSLLKQVRENGAWMGEELRAIMRRTGRARAVRGIGLMWGMDVVEPAAGVVARAMDAGLLILSAGEYTLRLLPPLAMTRAELREGLESLEEVLR